MSDPAYQELTDKIIAKSTTLYQSIESLEAKDVSVILNDARLARNVVAHDLARRPEVCLDSRIKKVNPCSRYRNQSWTSPTAII